MTIKEWIEELKHYEEDAEVVFSLCDDIECEAWAETKSGDRYVSVDTELKETFICECCGECFVDLSVKKE